MKRNNLITNIFIVLVISFTAVSTLFAQENHIQFSVVNDTARIDSAIPQDSLGILAGGDDESDLDNVDHGDGMLFTYFTWMPGYSRYQNFDIVRSGSSMIAYAMLKGARLGFLGKEFAVHGRKTFDGMVRISKGSNTGGYGNLVVIRHDNGLETYYAHLSRRLVNPGQMVKAGDIIGLGGSTGRSTGPHLHFEIRYLGIDINPNKVIDFENFKTRFDTLYISGYSVSTPNPPSHEQQQAAAAKKASTSGAVYYKVRKGDNLGRIAQKYHTTVSKIKKLNRLRSDFIREGQRLRVR